MRLEDSKLFTSIAELGVEHHASIAMSEYTSLGIGGTTDLLLIKKHESIPGLLQLLDDHRIPHKFLGGGSNLLVGDGELPWVVLQLAKPDPDVVLDGILPASTPQPTSVAPSPTAPSMTSAAWRASSAFRAPSAAPFA